MSVPTTADGSWSKKGGRKSLPGGGGFNSEGFQTVLASREAGSQGGGSRERRAGHKKKRRKGGRKGG